MTFSCKKWGLRAVKNLVLRALINWFLRALINGFLRPCKIYLALKKECLSPDTKT